MSEYKITDTDVTFALNGEVVKKSQFGIYEHKQGYAYFIYPACYFYLRVGDSGVGMSISKKTTAMEVVMPCGEVHTYKRFADIPSETTYCRCGNKEHIVIEYRDE